MYRAAVLPCAFPRKEPSLLSLGCASECGLGRCWCCAVVTSRLREALFELARKRTNDGDRAEFRVRNRLQWKLRVDEDVLSLHVRAGDTCKETNQAFPYTYNRFILKLRIL